MKDELNQLTQSFKEAVKSVQNSDSLEALRVEFLGRKGRLAELMTGLKDLTVEAKKEVGQLANSVKQELETGFAELEGRVREAEGAMREAAEWIDISAPGTAPDIGHLHITSQAIAEIVDIFKEIGFTRVRHPEVEWDWYAFEALNFPGTHPARDDWETFFIADGEKPMVGEKGRMLLTPHTSNGQVREMEKGEFPIRMLNIAKTYRRENDPRHIPMFHQFEGLYIHERASIVELKGVLDFFVKRFFGEDRVVRLRPHHFRFTEPSFEIDISAEHGRESSKMFKDGWHELGGAGMVHPNVIRAAGLDPEKYCGFAFGFGVERVMAMKSGINIDDLRIMYRNDLRFLKQF